MNYDMHDFHQHLTQSLADRLRGRRVVVWYDPRREFAAYVAELAGGELPDSCKVDQISVVSEHARLCVMQESFFEVKFAVEPMVCGDLPDPIVIYLPGKNRDDQTSVLMELEAGGDRWEPQLKREARRVLKNRFGDGQIDEMLRSENVTYGDIASLLSGSGSSAGSGALLEVIYGVKNNEEILAAWLAGDEKDDVVIEKGADRELRQLVASRLGLEVADDANLADLRRRTTRYVLVGEFRHDLEGVPPAALEMVPVPATKPHKQLLLNVAMTLRAKHAELYVGIAHAVEEELRLASQGIAPEQLGQIDTFQFEEQSLLDYVGRQIVDGKFAKAREIVGARRRSFWALHRMQRQEQWQAYGLAAELGEAIQQIGRELPEAKLPVTHWIEGYTDEGGWYRADQLHRRLESTLAAMSDPIASERVVHRVRHDYEMLVDKMARGFTNALSQSDWTVSGVLHQTHVYTDRVASPAETVCFVLVDALRYEMGVELRGLLEGAAELGLEPAVAAIPTITPIGMAALMPGAEQSFGVVQQRGDLAASIEGSVVANLNDRRKMWKGRVPNLVDLELEKVLNQSTSQLQKKVAGAPLILLRSVEIDAMGEGGNSLLGRRVMDTAISDVARAIRRLAAVGLVKFVIAADHGHLFGHERDESQRIDTPGGDEVSLHRRCWAGRGGSTPPGTVRITAAQLGYDCDLDFVFPASTSVFKAGGDLAYHHGGLSLQELLVPVISLRMPASKETAAADVKITLTNVPKQIANRIVTIGIARSNDMFHPEPVAIRPALMHKGQQVGHAGMALDAELNSLTHCVSLAPGSGCTVGIQLLREDVSDVEIMILDPDSDRVLAKSDKIPVKLGI